MSKEQLAPIIEALRAQRIGRDRAIPAMRAEFEAVASTFPKNDAITREDVEANVPAAWLRPEGCATDGAILYLHGGAYVLGSLNTHEAMVGHIAAACGLPALLIDYRLAPEHPHPAAVDDAVGAYRWLLDQGIASNRIVIAGDSAGGGLTLATLCTLRDAGAPLPACGVCISPWTDMEGSGESNHARADRDPIIEPAEIAEYAAYYVPDGNLRTPTASPIHADLSGLPPLLIQVGTEEVLYDDAITAANNAREAGVDTRLEVWDDMIHVWHMFALLVEEGQQAIDNIATFVQEKTTG